ncbi:MAG: lipid-A-disaccharide synthase N-terminal domain-containing protein [Alphaproteobacteria bacterium]|nr:lipid-A-disaccharide synthase N-terminal domain-containing protein [Alphaproteobacteria bacterium]MBV8548431.1 lipid-A-disaccharide synthase N-terminal domain-containing protein [Alphaproteobacteria bacterium]
MSEIVQNLVAWVQAHFNWWTVVGFGGQAMFMMRFVVQWIASEKEKKSVVPELFWYFSLAGGVVLFVYALHQSDPVFILGQGLGLFIYLRNMYFIWRHKKAAPQG